MDPSRPLTTATLPRLSLPWRVLFSGYLVVASVGLLMAGLQLLVTHGMADGKLGLSVEDVVYSYYGDRGNSLLEAKLGTTMKDKANEHDRAALVKWVRAGSPKDQWDASVGAVVAANCTKCHGVIPGLPSFTTYEGMKPYTQVDEGKTVPALARVSHIHLFGISFIFVFLCGIFALAEGLRPRLQALAIATPFAFLVVDIAAWWLTSWSPAFAWMTIIGGLSYNVAAAYMILTSLHQMWVLPWRRGWA